MLEFPSLHAGERSPIAGALTLCCSDGDAATWEPHTTPGASSFLKKDLVDLINRYIDIWYHYLHYRIRSMYHLKVFSEWP